MSATGHHATWRTSSLGELATYTNGRAFKKEEWKEAGLPIIRIQNLNDSDAAFNYTDADHEPRYRARHGDLLVAWAASLGAHIWQGGDAWVNQHIFRVEPREDVVSKKYLFYALKKALPELYVKAHGSGMVHVTRGVFDSHPVPLPPREEQDEIVAEIEKQFSRLDEAVANLQRVKANLKRYKAGVLDAAVKGKLVPGLDGTKWRAARIADVGQVTGGLTKNPKRKTYPRKLPYLRVANVYADELRLTEVEYIGVAESEVEKLLIRAGDMLIVEGNGSVDQIGRVALWDGSIPNCVHQNHLIKVRFGAQVMPKWAMCWLLSPAGRREIEQVSSSTSGLHTLSTGKVRRLPLPLPPLSMQERIVAEVARRLSLIVDVEAAASANLQRALVLQNATLARAFKVEVGEPAK